MGNASGLCRIYQGEYTVYQRDAMYCFLKGCLDTEVLSLADSFSMGGQYMFCPDVLEEQEVRETFIKNGIAYLKRWNRRLLFLWITNPETDFIHWKLNKLERWAGNQSLRFDAYRLKFGTWNKMTVQEDDFVFSYGNTGGYAFASGDITLPGTTMELRLMTTGDLCGTFSGNLLAPEGERESVMKKLDAGIRYFRMMEADEQEAAAHGFISQTVNDVLVPKGTLSIAFLLTPQQLYDTKRTRFELSGNIFSTHFATNTGKAVEVEADTDAALVFQQRPVLAYQDRQQQVRVRRRLYLGIEGGYCIAGEDTNLLCGLSGTETLLLKAIGRLCFYPSMPAVYPYENAELGTTSWIGSSTGGIYYCQPQKAALYGALSEQGLRYVEIPAADFEKEVPAVPMLPFRGIYFGETENLSVLEEGLYQKRREILLGTNGCPDTIFLSENTTAVTPQGLMVEVTPEGAYNWIGFANLSASDVFGESVPEMRFTQVDEELKRCFQQKELLYVIENKKELSKAKPEGFCFSIEGVSFSLMPDEWRDDTASRTMMIFKYSSAKSMEEALPDNIVLQNAIKNAYSNEGEIRDGYEELIAVVKDAGFQGILALNVAVSLDELPAEIKFLMNSVEPENFYAAYLIIRAGQIDWDANKGLVLKQSMMSGLVDYTADRKLSYDSTPPDYDYLTTEIRIQIQESKLISFISSSEVLLNRLFEVKAVSNDNPDGNCLVLQGRLVEKDNIKTYQYSLKQCVAYALSGSGISDVWIQRMDLAVGEQGEGHFLLFGVLACQEIAGADLLGYGGEVAQQGLPFSQLVLTMWKDGKASMLFSMEYNQLSYDRAAAVLREDSFPKNFAVYLESILVEQAGETLEQKGYTSISAPISQGVPDTVYQGFVWSIAAGSMGGLSGQGSIMLQLVTAFWPREDGKPEYYVGIRLPEVFSGDKLKLQGIFKLGFGSISLEKRETAYLFKLHNFHLEILGASLPQDSSDIFLFSDGEHVGWYGAYEEE